MNRTGAGGVLCVPRGQSFAPRTGPAIGNDLPYNSGLWPSTYYGEQDKPGPGPDRKPGYVVDGTAGAGNDGFFGADPRAPGRQPFPRVVAPVIEGQASNGQAGPGLGYAEGAVVRTEGPGRWGLGWSGRLGFGTDPLPHGRPSYWRGGIQGFNDKPRVVDRHAFWNTGHQVQGTDFSPASSPPNTYNDPLVEPPQARLRTVNRSITYQKGTDATRNQDDLS